MIGTNPLKACPSSFMKSTSRLNLRRKMFGPKRRVIIATRILITLVTKTLNFT
jgi:hypothetical protein